MLESDIAHFKVYKAEATREKEKLTVKLFYSRNPEQLYGRLDEKIQWGINTLEALLSGGYALIADQNNPTKPPSAGSLYLLKDNNIIVHRRDAGAPIHKLYHSACSGYTNSSDFVYTEKGLQETALRETAEECLLVTRDNVPRLVVPNDPKDKELSKKVEKYTLDSARRLGLALEPLSIDVEILDPSDRLEVYDEDNNLLYATKAFLDLQWEASTSISALQIRKLPLHVEDIVPIDAEGMIKDGKWIHFNRESYFLSLSDLEKQKFGTPLSEPRVFKTKIENGFPKVFTPEYEKPYFGPDKVETTDPHIWAPEDLLTTCLDGLEVEGYKGKKHDIEIWKLKSRRDGKSLIPEEYLIK